MPGRGEKRVDAQGAIDLDIFYAAGGAAGGVLGLYFTLRGTGPEHRLEYGGPWASVEP
ncbi:MAG TPA: hypothetical protein VN829_10630 [Dongiaceae bacterium]|nr:hypothetical protein [Dongiaceae bacterium]